MLANRLLISAFGGIIVFEFFVRPSFGKLFQDLIIWKPPFKELPKHPPRKVEWHQDYSYWPLNKPLGVTIWIALDESSSNNGTMCYIPKSHEWGECQATLYGLNNSYKEENELPQLQLNNAPQEMIHCFEGEGIAHHPLCCHMSDINRSNEHRRAWSLTFVSPKIKWDPDHAPHPLNHQLDPSQKQILNASRFPRFKKRI